MGTIIVTGGSGKVGRAAGKIPCISGIAEKQAGKGCRTESM